MREELIGVARCADTANLDLPDPSIAELLTVGLPKV
jgi:hypothetical protein